MRHANGKGARVRVLRVIGRLNVGGPALHVAYLSAGLASRGYETTLVAGSLAPREDSMAFAAERLEVPIVWVDDLRRDVSPVHDLAATLRLAQLIRRQRPHILHTHTAKAGAIGRVAALVAGDARPPIVAHTFHGHVLRGYFGPARSAGFRLLERWLARTCSVLVAVSPEVRDELLALGVGTRESFRVVRVGIDFSERVGLDGRAGAEVRRQLGITPGRFVIGWIGRMTAVKRTPDILVALRRLRDAGIDACACLVGDGPERRPVERRARELGVMRHTLFLGFQEAVAPFYDAFDVLVLPSVNEGTPVTAIEALAAGRPVVATRVGGVPDIVRHGENGYLTEPGDTEQLADFIGRLAADRPLRERLGSVGRAGVSPRFGVERLVGDVDRLYRSLLAERGIVTG